LKPTSGFEAHFRFHLFQVPPYAHHLVGVGGFVVNDNDEILAIEERFRISDAPHWKLPGGEFIATNLGDRNTLRKDCPKCM
jgi:hypothetical protein